jgi:hypothetical protein
LATEPTPQRSYRAACPHCGAPVDFRSAASAFAICSYCKSQIVREGEALRRIGEVAELFDDHSPLQLGAGGRYDGVAFTLVGRLQYRYKDGTWNEWHALFDNGRSGWLSEDNGRYVIAFEAPLADAVPKGEVLQPGERRLLDGRAWSVASVNVVRVISAQGELPRPPQLRRGFIVSDLRNSMDEVGTLDYGDPAAPQWSVGRSVALSQLSMSGLSAAAEKTLSARGLSQDNGSEPQIPLGSIGRFAFNGEPGAWQVVGYVERCEIASDEQSFWREYLLYRREAGFMFLVDTEDGWSWVVPLTGAPDVQGNTATHRGVRYTKRWDYHSRVTYVLGEFYWQLRRHQPSGHVDYAAKNRVLNREQTEGEVTWSAGATLRSDEVVKAFGLASGRADALSRDAEPVSSGFDRSNFTVVVGVILFFIVILTIPRCESWNECRSIRNTFGESSREYQECRSNNRSSSGGGSYGGYSSGGGHK